MGYSSLVLNKDLFETRGEILEMKHWALIIYSICIQTAIGITIFVGISSLLQHYTVDEKAILVAGVLAVIGNVASLFHLGRPLRAMGALMNFRTSWLSREIWLTGIFTGVIVIAYLLFIFPITNEASILYVIIVASIIGLLDVGAMALIYLTSSVYAWQHKAIAVEFYSAAISMGAALFIVICRGEIINQQQVIAFVATLTVTIQAIAMMLYYLDMGINNTTSNRHSILFLRKNRLVLVSKWVFILLGASLLIIPGLTEFGALMILVGQIAGRYLFYAIEVDPQIGNLL